MATKLLLAGLSVLLACAGCSTYNKPENSSGSDADPDSDAAWRDRFQRQCVNSGVQPGTPAMLKCIDDLMEIRSESQ